MKRVQRLVRMGIKRIDDMTDEEAKVLAMLIDTEGTITTMKDKKSGNIAVTVRVGMSGIIPIFMFQLWGGALFKRYNLKNPFYTWRVGVEFKRLFLTKIKPHLLQKQKQAARAYLADRHSPCPPNPMVCYPLFNS